MLTKYQVARLHYMLLSATGGLDGVRDIFLLESAIDSAFQTWEGEEMYPSMQEKFCRIAFNIAKNHPFLDGNKRIAVLTMLFLLKINNIEITYTQDELIKIGLGLADGTINYESLLLWVKTHIK
jgi:death-on-curing protein